MRVIAFALAMLTVVPALPAQDSSRARRAASDTLYRNPTSARVLGTILPGAGHVYAGEYLRGIGYYVGTVSTIGLGGMIYVLDKCTFTFLNDTPCKSPPAWKHQLLGGAVMAYGVGIWVYSAIDAGHAAERANRNHPRRPTAVSPFIGPRADSPGANVGLSLAW